MKNKFKKLIDFVIDIIIKCIPAFVVKLIDILLKRR